MFKKKILILIIFFILISWNLFCIKNQKKKSKFSFRKRKLYKYIYKEKKFPVYLYNIWYINIHLLISNY